MGREGNFSTLLLNGGKGAMKDKRYNYCYSYPQKEFLKKNGLRYILAAINQSTSKRYWLFEGCEELNRLLQEWRDNR